jgi:phage baseplate assembly protein gpV
MNYSQEYFGLYSAVVTDLVDPAGRARIQVRFPWFGGSDVRAWATLLNPFPSQVQGLDLGTQVVVGFEAGDLRRPYVIGTVWTGVAPTRVTLSSRQGHTVTLDDDDATVEMRHADGSTVTITAGGRIVVQAGAIVEVSAPTVQIRAPIAKFTGVVSCTTLIAEQTVMSPEIIPGPA